MALTAVYSISGIAVNHISDWNPNYQITKEFQSIPPIQGESREDIIRQALASLQLEEAPRNIFRPDPSTLQLFYNQKTISVDLPTGNVLIERTAQRRVLFEMNQLHLNRPKKLWTYIADLYAVALLVVAVTGLFVLKGKNGITGRGAWLTAIGVVIPIVYWIYYCRAN